MMLSIIITAFKEERTIGRAIESFLLQNIKKEYEIIIIAPDEQTQNKVLEYKKKNKHIYLIKDQGKGKPSALNLAFQKAKGSVLILTDGDVFVDKIAVKELLQPFKNKKVGAVTGRPVSLNSRNSMLGYFSHLLTDVGAHDTRMRLANTNKFLVCSGYLMAIRSQIVNKIPEETLSDDALISHLIYEKGYETKYAPKAKVYVKYPTSIKDWIKQKKRSTGGYLQLKKYTSKDISMRSFLKESKGIFSIFSYPKNIKEFFWTLCLIFMRLYLWLVIFIDIKLKRKSLKDIWLPVESTK